MKRAAAGAERLGGGRYVLRKGKLKAMPRRGSAAATGYMVN